MIIFKQFVSKPVSLEQLEVLRHPPAGTPSPVTETLEEGDFFCSYPEPISETEWQLLMGKLTEFRPDLIGIGVTTPTVEATREVTKRLKREFPKVPVIWGGIHPTINPEQCIQSADMVCIGEGEHAMVELAQDPDRTDVLGVWRRTNGEVVRNRIRPLEQELDRFPFASWGENEWIIDWNQLIPLPASNRGYFRGIYFTMTQRGCPFSCTYCFNHVRREQQKGERYVRRRSVEHSLAECEQRARDFDLPGFPFMDDVFIKDREWLEEFAEKYPRRVGLPFGGYIHPAVSDKKMVRLLVGAGLRFVTFGVQSGSQYIAHEIYNRRHSFDAIVELAQFCESQGLDLVYDMLSNCEYESEADCLETLKLLIRVPRPRLIQVKGVGVFPPMKIATLDFPKHRLPETTFEFWNLLYLMTRHREIAAEQLVALSQDEYLKAHPEALRAIALAFKQKEAQARSNREEVERLLKAQGRDVSVRGLLRKARRLVRQLLPKPVAEGVRAVLARLRRAEVER